MTPIHITAAAAQQLKQIIQDNPGHHVKVRLNNKGCSGHSYEWSLCLESDIAKYDHRVDLGSGTFVVDSTSLLKLWGSTLDYVQEHMGSQFVWQNPNVKVTCGCGESVGF